MILDSPQLKRAALPLIGSCQDDNRILLYMAIEGFVALFLLVIGTATAATWTACVLRKRSEYTCSETTHL